METETIAGTSNLKTTKRWVFPEEPNQDELGELLEIKGLHPVLAGLLHRRNLKTEAGLKQFFNPSTEDLHDPFLMKDMDKAVARVKLALEREERIMVFGDYDVDGTTSTTLVYKFLSRWYDNLEYYIPDRYAEGYGISFKGIDRSEERRVGKECE
jgi:single-stranded-DNA-specific exonuclease